MMAAANRANETTQTGGMPPWLSDATSKTGDGNDGGMARQTGRIPSLDGLRALAILAIVAYHLNVEWLPSGHMGVVMFLVLTGYLVTGSLMRARVSGTGAGSFVRRRLRRIWPAMAVMIVIVTAFCTLFNHVMLTKLRPDVLPSLVFLDNIAQIIRGASYFGQIGGTSPLTHLWYLGVSEQVCLLLVVLAPFASRLGHRRAGTACLALAALSALLMAVLYVPDADPTRVYYGTDTRAFAPLLGVWLALAMADEKPSSQVLRPLRAVLGVAPVVAPVCLLALAAVMVLVPADSPVLYRGGMAAVALVSTALVAALATNAGPVGRLLSVRPLIWLGTRSYSLYLWHFPIITLLGVNATHSPWWRTTLALTLSIGLAEASYRLFERVRGKADKTPRHDEATNDRQRSRQPRQGTPRTQRTFGRRADREVAIALGTVAVILTSIVGLALVPDTTLVPEDALVSTGVSAGKARDLLGDGADFADSGTAVADDEVEVSDTTPPPVDVDAVTSAGAAASLVAAGGYAPIIIGDSVPGDAEWTGAFPNALLDNYIGRQPFQANAVLQGYLDQGVVGPVVVMAAYSNSTPSIDNLNEAIAAVGEDRQIFLVGTVNSDGFQEQANANITAVANASDDDNVHYIDWPSVCAGHEGEYLWADATHLRPEGAVVYVNTILRAVAQAMVDAGGSVTYGAAA